MGELAINQIIKIILGVLVFVVVIASIALAFKGYIKPYFEGISPANDTSVDLNSQYYKNLVQDKNLVATIDNSNYILIGSTKTSYYLSKNRDAVRKDIKREILSPSTWKGYEIVGTVGKDRIIRITEPNDSVLKAINLGEIVGNRNGIYRIQS